eukprot:gene11569-biopygen8394
MCKHGYVYNRDGGYRCAGGSHYADSADGQALAAAQSQTRIVKRPPVVTECKHGYSFNRDGGSRCQGGSHVKDAADDVFAPQEPSGDHRGVQPRLRLQPRGGPPLQGR